MSKLIIENRSKATDQQALDCVKKVIDMGRISNDGKQYCYASTLEIVDITGKNRVLVYTDLNKKSDRFVVIDYTDQEDE